VLAYTSERLRNVSTGPTSNEENKQVPMPVSRRVVHAVPFSHVACRHKAILSHADIPFKFPHRNSGGPANV
jgi:hypothetical protein